MSKTTLVVLAHPEPRSFNGAWAASSRKFSEESGHKVLFSDLVADGFDPVESAERYTESVSDIFDPLKAQENAAAKNTLPADVQREMQKIEDADRIILHFPVWWFTPPAILKGWLDRCLVHGGLHDIDNRFDRGRCKGKKVLFCVTTGATPAECSFAGKEGDINLLLWPLAQTFRYLGCDVLEPRLVHGVHGYFEGSDESALQTRLSDELAQHRNVINNFDDLKKLQFNSDSDFDENGVLMPDAKSYSAFIRHQ